ncbi:TetR/AcrR family transcriptional regulator [Natrialba sp. PRR66]|uniref:TetR/AcrR family transcriptional regulator n=1 Tax=Natrialba sp. PRR66 TaxID=3098146 RepID=UPI002B1D6E57|nr:TetR/AcrR family transcriptional regulator [Natrialba sp. PRR66]
MTRQRNTTDDSGERTGSGDDLDPVKREIMEATYRALSTHGYGDLTIQAIADEFDNSKSLLYYHYDGKDELLLDFLDYALGQFLTEIQVSDDAPDEQLRTLIDTLVPETLPDDPYRVQLAMFELRVNAPHDADARTQYLKADRELKTLLRSIVERGITSGEFVPVDPDLEAELFLSLLTGTRTRRLTANDEFSIETARAALLTQLRRLKVDDAAPASPTAATTDSDEA